MLLRVETRLPRPEGVVEYSPRVSMGWAGGGGEWLADRFVVGGECGKKLHHLIDIEHHLVACAVHQAAAALWVRFAVGRVAPTHRRVSPAHFVTCGSFPVTADADD